ncbi:MAG: hypothetical protein JKY49_14600 [Cohaesibacteraceae bacterium]|nr:hypothetical protein [Cohaesibacteraceae bacterium]
MSQKIKYPSRRQMFGHGQNLSGQEILDSNAFITPQIKSVIKQSVAYAKVQNGRLSGKDENKLLLFLIKDVNRQFSKNIGLGAINPNGILRGDYATNLASLASYFVKFKDNRVTTEFVVAARKTNNYSMRKVDHIEIFKNVRPRFGPEVSDDAIRTSISSSFLEDDIENVIENGGFHLKLRDAPDTIFHKKVVARIQSTSERQHYNDGFIPGLNPLEFSNANILDRVRRSDIDMENNRNVGIYFQISGGTPIFELLGVEGVYFIGIDRQTGDRVEFMSVGATLGPSVSGRLLPVGLGVGAWGFTNKKENIPGMALGASVAVGPSRAISQNLDRLTGTMTMSGAMIEASATIGISLSFGLKVNGVPYQAGYQGDDTVAVLDYDQIGLVGTLLKNKRSLYSAEALYAESIPPVEIRVSTADDNIIIYRFERSKRLVRNSKKPNGMSRSTDILYSVVILDSEGDVLIPDAAKVVWERHQWRRTPNDVVDYLPIAGPGRKQLRIQSSEFPDPYKGVEKIPDYLDHNNTYRVENLEQAYHNLIVGNADIADFIIREIPNADYRIVRRLERVAKQDFENNYSGEKQSDEAFRSFTFLVDQNGVRVSGNVEKQEGFQPSTRIVSRTALERMRKALGAENRFGIDSRRQGTGSEYNNSLNLSETELRNWGSPPGTVLRSNPEGNDGNQAITKIQVEDAISGGKSLSFSEHQELGENGVSQLRNWRIRGANNSTKPISVFNHWKSAVHDLDGFKNWPIYDLDQFTGLTKQDRDKLSDFQHLIRIGDDDAIQEAHFIATQFRIDESLGIIGTSDRTISFEDQPEYFSNEIDSGTRDNNFSIDRYRMGFRKSGNEELRGSIDFPTEQPGVGHSPNLNKEHQQSDMPLPNPRILVQNEQPDAPLPNPRID